MVIKTMNIESTANYPSRANTVFFLEEELRPTALLPRPATGSPENSFLNPIGNVVQPKASPN